MSRLRLDRTSVQLWDDTGRAFEPRLRVWRPASEPPAGEAVTPTDAARWLQRESGSPCRVPVGVIGAREANATQRAIAEAVGRSLAGLGLTILCGGREGTMEAVCRGAAASGGVSIGLLPDPTPEGANPYVTHVIPTGLGIARNAVIARAALCLVAIGGGTGTLSEIAMGLQFGKPVFRLEGAPAVEGMYEVPDAAAVPDLVARVLLALPLQEG